VRGPFLLAVGFFGLAGNLCNQERAEWVRHVIAEGFSAQTAVAADFTGDGRLDVITGDITPNRERTILYVAPDWKPVVLHTGIRTIHGAVIDVDGNGKPDFVGARYHPGLVYWLERPADPLHDPWPYHLVDDAAQGGADGVHGLWAGDVDGDGKIDLAASSGQPLQTPSFGSVFRPSRGLPLTGSDMSWLTTMPPDSATICLYRT